jgi:hypothetical protein
VREAVILESVSATSFDLDAVRKPTGWAVTSDDFAATSTNAFEFRSQFASCVSALEDKYLSDPEKIGRPWIRLWVASLSHYTVRHMGLHAEQTVSQDRVWCCREKSKMVFAHLLEIELAFASQIIGIQSWFGYTSAFAVGRSDHSHVP